MREALGLDQPSWVRYLLWLKQFFWVEPLHLVDHWFGTAFRPTCGARGVVADKVGPNSSSAPASNPVGGGHHRGRVAAIPIGVISAYKRYRWFDQVGTFISMVGFSVSQLLHRRGADRGVLGQPELVSVYLRHHPRGELWPSFVP